MSQTVPILSITGLCCSYGKVPVLHDIDLSLAPGEILGIAGENGAGKSTLVKAVCGILAPASGSISCTVKVAAIHQEFNLAPDLTAAENIFLGQEHARFGLLDRRYMYAEAERLFADLGVTIPPDAPVNSLKVAEKQMVEIVKAVSSDAGLLIMDEPTTVLNEVETEKLFRLIRSLTAKGYGIIYISHKLREMLDLCGRIQIFRDGSSVGCFKASELTPVTLAEKMVGREMNRMFPEKSTSSGNEPLLEVEHLCAPGVHDASFALHRGEILGVAGLNGAGRTELAEALYGIRKVRSGTVRIRGKAVKIRSPRSAMKNRIGLLTEDRQGSGLLIDFPIEQNMTLASLEKYGFSGILDFRKIREQARKYINLFSLKCRTPDEPVRDLSGGNQQKAAIAKCLDTAPEIFFFDEPTRGVDVGARREIYDFVHALAEKGAGCLLISSDLEELIGLCGKVMVIREGRIAGTLCGTEVNEKQIIHLATGV